MKPTQEQTALEHCLDKLRILHGLPPYDTPSNICRSDGYFAKSIERDFPDVLKAAQYLISKELKAWEHHRKAFILARSK